MGGKQVPQGKGEADHPLAERDIGKHHRPAGRRSRPCGGRRSWGWASPTESALLAGKRNKPLEVAFVAAHPEEAVFEATALQIGLEFPVNMVGQGFALLGQLVHQGGVVLFDELVEQCLLRLMALVGSFPKAIPINRGRLSLPCPNTVVPPRISIVRNEPDWGISLRNATSEACGETAVGHQIWPV